MTYQDLLQLNSTLQNLDTQSMDVEGKVAVYRILQGVEDEMATYQKTLQSITEGQQIQSLSDLSENKQKEVQELLNTEIQWYPQYNLDQDQLPDSITVQEIAVLDNAELLMLD